ncbi:MAG: sigma-54-dependent Fis family transcriptional regulator [Parachlamydiaceae bacterium]|nr:sigma-54-dependent Fis family transcriptional regulator [Parachlamydiaceae bacterium]
MKIDKVLIIDDEPLMRSFLEETLLRMKIDVTTAENGRKALEILEKGAFDLIISDMKMPGISGIDLLRKVKELYPETIFVVITGFGSIESAVEAMRLGAYNYLIKPFSPETIETLIEKASEQRTLLAENSYLRQQVRGSQMGSLGFKDTNSNGHSEGNVVEVIGDSPALRKILSDVLQIAKSNANVFIHGESGTGKEVIAHAIHYNSLRKNRPFIKVNCAAVPDTLIESEFFGHEKGAFTGANAKREGRFELANGGTLLLDEVTEIPLLLQAKMLRVIQEQEFERVGGTKSLKVDVRLISTSNREMKDAISAKVLREDLYYRLNVVPIYLPPLRDRQEDILPLAEHFLKKLCLENHKDPKSKIFTPESQKLLLAYSWPGNVRELANVIERAIVMDPDKLIAPEHLCLEGGRSAGHSASSLNIPFGTPLHILEKQLILETFKNQQEDPKSTAELLGITPRKLRTKLASYQLK